MRQTHIDGVKNDVRVLCTGPNDSEDAGLVEGVPIDPPDYKPGWLLVDFWVEHDTVQEKGEKGQVITRKVNPVYHQLWVRPKSPPKTEKRGRGRPKKAATPAAAAPAPKPGKKQKTKTTEEPPPVTEPTNESAEAGN